MASVWCGEAVQNHKSLDSSLEADLAAFRASYESSNAEQNKVNEHRAGYLIQFEETHAREVSEANVVSSRREVKFGTIIAVLRTELDALAAQNKVSVATAGAASDVSAR